MSIVKATSDICSYIRLRHFLFGKFSTIKKTSENYLGDPRGATGRGLRPPIKEQFKMN